MRSQVQIYSGVHFRSRLEARWAMEFDRQKVKWKYEPIAIPIDGGRTYTPDFMLDMLDGVFVEVKPTMSLLHAEDAKVLSVSLVVSNAVVGLVGPPRMCDLVRYADGERRVRSSRATWWVAADFLAWVSA